MLSFESQTAPIRISLPPFANIGSIQKVAAIELDRRLSSKNVHHTTGVRIMDCSRMPELSIPTTQDKVMVIPEAKPDLLMIIIDAFSYGRR